MNIEDIVYDSYVKAKPFIREKRDALVRKPEYAYILLKQLGFIDEPIPAILVTGSKGKGSVSRMIAYLLEKANYRVGHFSSPHLLDFRERIRVNGRAISEQDLLRLGLSLMPLLEILPVQHEKGEYVGPIAISQAIALLYFREQKVDVAVFEAGRGGRFDDTNQIPHKMSVITPIMEEHLEQLGPTISEVVWNKLGIIDKGVEQALIGKQRQDVGPLVDEVLEQMELSGKLYKYGSHFSVQDVQVSLDGTKAWIESIDARRLHVTLPLLGGFQAENFSLAYSAVSLWSNSKLTEVKDMHLEALRWPGRCEVLERSPLVLLDGGVHRTSAESVRSLIMQIPHERLFVLLSIPKDKDIAGVLQTFGDVSCELYTTTTSNPYLYYDYDYDGALKQHKINGRHIPSLEEAFRHIREKACQKDIFLCMGTQSFVGDILRLYGKSIADL